MENENSNCIVTYNGRTKWYRNGTCYSEDICDAKICRKKKLPKYITNNPLNVIIPLDTAEGLELLVVESEKLQHQIEQEKDENEVKRMKAGLKRLYNSNPEMINKYNCKRAKYLPISLFTRERQRLIIKEIVSGKSIILE